jgi:hypothetical protein
MERDCIGTNVVQLEAAKTNCNYNIPCHRLCTKDPEDGMKKHSTL